MVGPIRRCQGSKRKALILKAGGTVYQQCDACLRVQCHFCGRYIALYPNGCYVVHLPQR